jgi:hypothetical protein
MRMGMASARLDAGDRTMTLGEMWGDPYSRIHVIRDAKAATGLPIMVAKAFVDAYKWDRARTIEAACEYARGKLPRHLDLEPKMKTKKWLEIREAIEAEPDLERYRCMKVQLYIYLLSRSTRYSNICKRGEARIERPRWDDQ